MFVGSKISHEIEVEEMERFQGKKVFIWTINPCHCFLLEAELVKIGSPTRDNSSTRLVKSVTCPTHSSAGLA